MALSKYQTTPGAAVMAIFISNQKLREGYEAQECLRGRVAPVSPSRFLFGETMDEIIWKPVVGWEGIYEVSNTGCVKSLSRISIHKNGFVQRIYGRILKCSIDAHGYRCADLRKPGTRKNAKVHRIVMGAFIGQCPIGKEARHWDGNKKNNRVSNLVYGTRQDNVNDTKRHGRVPAGDNHWKVKIPDKEIPKILNSKKSIAELCRKYCVSWACIYDILHGNTRRQGHGR